MLGVRTGALLWRSHARKAREQAPNSGEVKPPSRFLSLSISINNKPAEAASIYAHNVARRIDMRTESAAGRPEQAAPLIASPTRGRRSSGAH
jgi:hypothetical protein